MSIDKSTISGERIPDIVWKVLSGEYPEINVALIVEMARQRVPHFEKLEEEWSLGKEMRRVVATISKIMMFIPSHATDAQIATIYIRKMSVKAAFGISSLLKMDTDKRMHESVSMVVFSVQLNKWIEQRKEQRAALALSATTTPADA